MAGFILRGFCPADTQRAFKGCLEQKSISAVKAEWPKAESADPQHNTCMPQWGKLKLIPPGTPQPRLAQEGHSSVSVHKPATAQALGCPKCFGSFPNLGKTPVKEAESWQKDVFFWGCRGLGRARGAKWGTEPYVGSKKCVDVALRDTWLVVALAVLGNGWTRGTSRAFPTQTIPWFSLARPEVLSIT